uniref:hypothetical protein n=1 Tax=Marinobacterium profundum TaxID=1714300 RepID=UPI00082F56EE|nr:hypothetical protein [Marinobacterium profundum]
MQAYAVGTAAGTPINNTASVSYSQDGGATTLSKNSPTVTNLVAELLDVNLVSQDASAISVGQGDTQSVLTFLLTNTGNGNDTYNLAASNTAGDNFDTSNINIYIDNGDGIFNAASDTLYVPSSTDPALPADGDVVVFIASDIPPGAANDEQGVLSLTATSNTGSGAPGTIFTGAGDGGLVDVVVGNSTGIQIDDGGYIISTFSVGVDKVSTVTNEFGHAEPIPGATIVYTVTANITGSGTATNMVLADPIPTNTSYNAGSLRLDGVALTDASDAADDGDYNITTAGAITVDLGDVTVSSETKTYVVSFSVTVD